MSKRALEQLKADLDIGVYWADEVFANGPNAKGWARISDVGCSRNEGAVAVPRRRISAYHWAEVLHEVAHLQTWRWKNKSPASHYEPAVCALAIEIAQTFGFGADTIAVLNDDLARVFAETTFVKAVRP